MDFFPDFSTTNIAISFYLLCLFIIALPCVLVWLSFIFIKAIDSDDYEKSKSNQVTALGIFLFGSLVLQVAVTLFFNAIFNQNDNSIEKYERNLADYDSVIYSSSNKAIECSLEIKSSSVDSAICPVSEIEHQLNDEERSVILKNIQNLKDDRKTFEFVYPILNAWVGIGAVLCSGILINLATASRGASSKAIKELHNEIKALKGQLTNVKRQSDCRLSTKNIIIFALMTSVVTSVMIVMLYKLFG